MQAKLLSKFVPWDFHVLPGGVKKVKIAANPQMLKGLVYLQLRSTDINNNDYTGYHEKLTPHFPGT